HIHKGKASRVARVAIRHDLNTLDDAIGRTELAQFFLGGAKGQIPDKNPHVAPLLLLDCSLSPRSHTAPAPPPGLAQPSPLPPRLARAIGAWPSWLPRAGLLDRYRAVPDGRPL